MRLSKHFSAGQVALIEDPLATDAMAWYPAATFAPQIRQLLTLKHTFNDEEETIRLWDYNHDKSLIGIPREIAPPPRKDNRVKAPAKFGERLLGPRNPQQVEALVEAFTLLEDGRSFIIEASTGFGKCFLGLSIMGFLQQRTLVVVNKQDNMDTWLDDAEKFYGLSRNAVGIIQQDRCEIAGHNLVIGMVQTMYRRLFTQKQLRHFGLVIFDEVHHMSAEQFGLVTKMFPAFYRIGLSATVKRSDRKEFIFESHIGPVAVSAKLISVRPKVLMVETGYKLPKFWDRDLQDYRQMHHEPGKLGHVLTRMAKDSIRNAVLVKVIMEAYVKERRVLVLSELGRDKFLNLLAAYLMDKGVPEADIGYYTGEEAKKPKLLLEYRARRIVLATYGMTAESTNFPPWDTCIMATPRANVQQPIGRVLREHEGKKQPVIIDLVDSDSWVLRQYMEKRLKLYRSSEINAEVLKIDI